MAIVLQFSTDNDLGSTLVRAFDHSWLSHVDAVTEDGNLIGARIKGGVEIRPPEYTNFTRVKRMELPASLETEKKFYDFLHNQLGKPYDWLAILGFVLNRNWSGNNSWICSELIAAGLVHSGWLTSIDSSVSKITPNDLYLIVTTWLESFK